MHSFPKVWTYIGRCLVFLCPVIILVGNLYTKNSSAAAWLQKKGTVPLLPAAWEAELTTYFWLVAWFGRESANLESFHGADFLQCASSFPTKIMQAESLALNILEQQKLLVPPEKKVFPGLCGIKEGFNGDKFNWQYCIFVFTISN